MSLSPMPYTNQELCDLEATALSELADRVLEARQAIEDATTAHDEAVAELTAFMGDRTMVHVDHRTIELKWVKVRVSQSFEYPDERIDIY